MKKYKKEIILLIFIVLVSLMMITLYSVFRKPIQTTDKKDGSKIPHINIDSVDTSAINKYIDELYNNYSMNGKSKIDYIYYKYDDIYSILLIIDNYNQEKNDFIKEYISFNIKKDGTFINKEELSELFGFELEEIVDLVDMRLQKYYNNEIEQKYIDKKQCDYSCYLISKRGINNILDNISLVIEEGKLVAYVNLNNTRSDDEDYFLNLDYNPNKIVIE